ncbi:MAG: hypothetical protein L3J81_00790, partial [Thermoplasmata archaeon]|nr:hypothetical protein [Thermoplasmata archaeon]
MVPSKLGPLATATSWSPDPEDGRLPPELGASASASPEAIGADTEDPVPQGPGALAGPQPEVDVVH